MVSCRFSLSKVCLRGRRGARCTGPARADEAFRSGTAAVPSGEALPRDGVGAAQWEEWCPHSSTLP